MTAVDGGHDKHAEHEPGAGGGAGQKLDGHEPTAARRREQRPRDRAVTKLVRHEDASR